MGWGADMLIIKNLKFGHGSHIVVAENTAFGGGIYGVIGPSGSGKSTFLNTLAGFHDCQSGYAIFEDGDLLDPTDIFYFCVFVSPISKAGNG